MNLLLDTHVLLWWVDDSPKLSPMSRQLLANSRNRLIWSAASTWEASIKHALGRLKLPRPPAEFFPTQLRINRIESLPIHDHHAVAAAELPPHHADPFDRMLIAQAHSERLTIVSADVTLRQYRVDVTW